MNCNYCHHCVINLIYFHLFVEKVLEDLCTITRWLNGPGKDDSIGKLNFFISSTPPPLPSANTELCLFIYTDFMSVYAQIRSNSLVRSVQV